MKAMRITFEERMEATRQMLKDPDLILTTKEVSRHLYHVLMYELALIKIKKGRKALAKHADILNDDIEAFSLRKQMKDL